jgi:RNA-directed DNA polymerase
MRAAISAPLFLDTSYGFRPGRSGHDAWRRLNQEVLSAPVDGILTRDLARLFDTRPHTERLAVLAERMADQLFLRRMTRRLKAGGQTPEGVIHDALGSPQGSIVAPVLAPVFLDTVLDQWVATTVTPHGRGSGMILR